jgi:hypothetical protein
LAENAMRKVSINHKYNKWYYYNGNVPESEYGVSQEYIPSFKKITIGNKISNIKNAIKNELPIEIGNSVTIVKDVPF